MIKEGNVRIGTFDVFKRMEEDLARGDKDEGARRSRLKDLYNVTDTADLSPEIQESYENFIEIENCGSGSVINVERVDQSKDYYLYCVSSVFSHDIAKRITAESPSSEPTDSCIIIWNIEELSIRITKALKNISQGKPVIREIKYIKNYKSSPPEYSKVKNIHPALIKDKDLFGYQKEWRSVWLPRKPIIKNLEPIKIGDLSDICSFINFEEKF